MRCGPLHHFPSFLPSGSLSFCLFIKSVDFLIEKAVKVSVSIYSASPSCSLRVDIGVHHTATFKVVSPSKYLFGIISFMRTYESCNGIVEIIISNDEMFVIDVRFVNASFPTHHVLPHLGYHRRMSILTDVFLAHDWGKELGQDNHARVSMINKGLQARGVTTWFDEEKMTGNIKDQMANGIDNASVIIVFITKRYCEKVAQKENEDDNCKLEFNYAAHKKTHAKMIAVVMEERMCKNSDWEGSVGLVLGMNLCFPMWGDLDDPVYFNAQIGQLYKEIQHKISIERLLKYVSDEASFVEALVNQIYMGVSKGYIAEVIEQDFPHNLMQLALEKGKQRWGRSKITFVGHGGAGKTGTERSMMGYEFEHTESTLGINNDLMCEILSELANVGDEDGLQPEDDMLWTKAERAEKEYENAVAKLATAIKQGRLKAEAAKRELEVIEAMKNVKIANDTDGVQATGEQRRAEVVEVQEIISVGGAGGSRGGGDGGKRDDGNDLMKPLPDSNATEFDTAEYLKMLAKDLQMNSKLLISLFDFGGQEIFGAVTPLFMTRYGVYVLVFNMECFHIKPEDMSKNDPKRGMISWEECTKVMKQWLNSIVVHTSYELRGSMRTAPIFIVGTHRDAVSSSAHHQSISSAISAILHEDHPAFGSIKKNDREGLIYYPVDNTLGRLDPTMKFLMKNIEAVIEKEEYVLVTKSLTWFRLLDKINSAPRSFLRYSEVVAFAKECGIINTKEYKAVDEMLEYFHEFGAVLWHNDPGTREVVIKDPVKFLVKPSANIICQHTATATDPTVHKLPEPIQRKIDSDSQHKKDFNDMKSIGRISHRLLECLLSEGEHSEFWEIVKLLMIKYGLLVPLRREEGEGNEKTDLKYLVPALLSEGARDDSDVVIGHRFYFHFSATLSGSSDDCLQYKDMKEGFLPGGLFVRLIGKVLGWSQDTTLSKAKNWTCHKHWMSVFFGRQEFRLTYLVDHNAMDDNKAR